LGHREPLGSSHPAEPGRQHALPGEGAIEVGRCDCAESLVGEPKDALRPDVEPAGRRHLAVHRQPGVLQPAKRLLVRPRRDDHRGRNENPGRVRMRGEDGHGLARLYEQRLLRPDRLERRHDLGERLRAPRRPAAASVDHQ
jgi:hypothetical protein